MRSSVLLNRFLAKLRIRHLQAVVKLSELGNIHRAAQALGMTQPAVTLLLADLERLIEARLFVRHARGVTPTALMQDLLPLARQMLHRLEDSAEMVASHLDHNEGVVRVAATTAGANGLLAAVLPAFSERHPQVQVLVSEMDPSALSAAASMGATDLVCCRRPAVAPKDWRFIDCLPDRLVVVCGKSHPLARRRRLRLQDLRSQRWLPNMVATSARQRFEELMPEPPPGHPNCQVITRISTLTWTLLDTQPLVTLVPLSVVRPWVERRLLHVLPLEQHLPFEPIGMLCPESGIGSATERLLRFVQAFAQQAEAPAR